MNEVPLDLGSVERALSQAGFDLVKAFSVSGMNRQLAETKPESGGNYALPEPQDGGLGLIIGNSRALWRPFSAHLESEGAASTDPLDDYVERTVRHLCSSASALFFAHHHEPPLLPIQRIAHAAGLATLGPAGLNIHAEFGPWIGLRAVAIFPGSCFAFREAPALSPCADCSAPCTKALETALGPEGAHDGEIRSGLVHLNITPRAARFLLVREVCPVGRAARYSDRQIEFHYQAAFGRP